MIIDTSEAKIGIYVLTGKLVSKKCPICFTDLWEVSDLKNSGGGDERRPLNVYVINILVLLNSFCFSFPVYKIELHFLKLLWVVGPWDSSLLISCGIKYSMSLLVWGNSQFEALQRSLFSPEWWPGKFKLISISSLLVPEWQAEIELHLW